MNDYFLTKRNLPDLITELQNELEEKPALKVTVGPTSTGKWGMAKLWRMWMETTGEFMAANGVTMPLMIDKDGVAYKTRPFNKSDAHELFTSMWLGADNNGTRLSWSKAGHDGMRAADSGERFNALQRHELWAIDKGIILFKPREGEYHELAKKQIS
jgi:hypothetical protein